MSVSQSSQIPILAGGFITTQLIQSKTSISARQCKIIATIGPSCWDVHQLETLMNCGMNTALLDMSHGTQTIHHGIVERIRQAATNVRRNIAIVMDLMGPDMRTGKIDTPTKTIELKKGDIITIKADPKYIATDNTMIGCTYPNLASIVTPGNQIFIANGSLVLTVISTDPSYRECGCRIENHCILGDTKNMCIPGMSMDFLPTFTSKDIDDIVTFGIPVGVDFISASLVRKASDVKDLRQLLSEHGSKSGQKQQQQIKILSKIDSIEGLRNFNEILQVSDGIIISRGDLGMELPPQKIFLAQKMMIRECNIVGKPVIVATQMLESMIHNPRPTRAECSDVANAVLDGTDALMLGDETSISPYYDRAVKVMARTICEAECSRNYNALYTAVRNSVIHRFGMMSPTESLASSAVKTAIDVDARIIVVLSESGYTARYISKFRPGKFIVCLTKNDVVARQTSGLYKGVHSYIVDSFLNDSILAQETGQEAIKAGLAKPGDLMVIVCGNLHEIGPSKNNQVRVESISEDPIEEEGENKQQQQQTNQRKFSKLQSFEVAYNDDAHLE